jgi:hypothetical protein
MVTILGYCNDVDGPAKRIRSYKNETIGLGVQHTQVD